MRRIVYGMAVSLDGFMEGPKGETDWMVYNADNAGEYIEPFDTFLMGRKSYEVLLKMGASASAFPGIALYVFSNSLKEVKTDFKLTTGDAVVAVRKMKNLPGKDIALYGGAVLGSALLNEGLVDEVVVSVQSILLGAGRPMFRDLNGRISMELTKAKPYPSGIVLHYKVSSDSRTRFKIEK